MNFQLKAQHTHRLLALRDDESGQDMAEYAVLIGLVSLAVIVVVAVLGGTISTVFKDIGTSFTP